jgi:hypothetical protein
VTIFNKIFRSERRRPPIVVEIDLENDEYNPTVWGEAAWRGVPLAFATLEALRNTLAAEGQRARFAWGLRLDPQIAIGEGRSDYVLNKFAGAVAAAQRHGDSFGPHPHWFRLAEGAWIEDTTDAAWVAQCIDVSLATFRAAFGKTPAWIHFGESWMDQACFNRAIDEGIRLILTPEPGMKINPAYLPGPAFRGTYPEYPSYLRRPYWASRRTFRRRGLQRRTIIVPRTAAPLTTRVNDGSTHTNCWISEDPRLFQEWIGRACADGRGSYFLLAARSHVFNDTVAAANVIANLRWLVTAVDGPQGDLVTPEEAFLKECQS